MNALEKRFVTLLSLLATPEKADTATPYRGGFYGHGDPEPYQAGEHSPVDGEEFSAPDLNAVSVAVSENVNRSHGKGQHLTEDRGESRSRGSHLKDRDEKNIQEDIRHSRYADKDKGPYRVSHTAQYGADHIISVDKDQSPGAYRGIAQSLGEGLRRCIHHPQDRYAERYAHRAEDRGDRHEEGKHRSDKPADLPLLSRSEILGYDHLARAGKAHGNEGEEVRHIAPHGHSRQADLAQLLSHYDHIHHIIHDLQEIGREEGRGKAQQLRRHAPLREVAHI